MKNNLINIARTGRLKLQYTPHSKIPMALLDNQLLCHSELKEKWNFDSIEEFALWMKANFPGNITF